MSTNESDAYCCFIPNTSKHFPSLLRRNFLALSSDPDEFALWCRRQAISLVSSCPLRPSRRLGACFLFTHTSLLLCRWKAGTLGICGGVLLTPPWGIASLPVTTGHQQKDNQSLGCLLARWGLRKELLAQPQMPVSANATGSDLNHAPELMN